MVGAIAGKSPQEASMKATNPKDRARRPLRHGNKRCGAGAGEELYTEQLTMNNAARQWRAGKTPAPPRDGFDEEAQSLLIALEMDPATTTCWSRRLGIADGVVTHGSDSPGDEQ